MIDPAKLEGAAAPEPFNPAKLTRMLLSRRKATRRRGLSAFAELGRRCYAVMDAALTLIDDPEPMVRNDVLDGVISCSRSLNADQAARVLARADDDFDLVRDKVIAFMGAIDTVILEAAIDRLAEPTRSAFQHAMKAQPPSPAHAQAVFDEVCDDASIRAAVVLARLQRLAREGFLTDEIVYRGDAFLGQSVSANINRLARGALRRRVKQR